MNDNLTAGTPAPFTQVAETTNNTSQRALELAKNWSEEVISFFSFPRSV